ncbi:MAG: DNA repair protein RecN [Clostridia bacterium]|nr:DNA repair protein RecN [Clostridia bacterium]
MLKSLHIENIAIIEETDIDFVSGFNCLTGETGAGKSIIIDAINAVLGERTSKDIIRTGANRAFVSALFGDLSDTSIEIIKENGFFVDENGELLISRTITEDRGSVKINGKPANLAVLKNIAKHLVNIHGQHDNQTLLVPENHFRYIDKIAENDELLFDYYKEFKNLNAIRKELSSLETDEGEKLRTTEMLKYQIEEIEALGITPGETEELKEKLKIINSYEKIVLSLNSAYEALSGSDDTDGALSLISNAEKEILKVDINSLENTKSNIAGAKAAIESVMFDLKDVIEDNDYSKADAENIRSRLDTLRRVVLKYGGTEEKTLDFLQKAKEQLNSIESSDKRIEELSSLLDESTERLINKAAKITKSRKDAAQKFEREVTEKLSYLNMEGASFVVSINEGRYTKYGCDNIEFMIMTNAGDTYKPLVKIASGGELSRVMLAIKSVLAGKDDVDTLIFDEIDTGISGRAADKVGVLLKGVSKSRQVVCVTHLAQIASYAKNHLLIEKSVSSGKTYTLVKSLSGDDRVNEIARIMSGTDITDNLYKSAKELLDRSR